MAKHTILYMKEAVTNGGKTRAASSSIHTSKTPHAQDIQQIQWPYAMSIIAVAHTAPQRRWASAVAIALTQRLSQLQHNVVLVDFDGPTSRLSKDLNVRHEEGIADVLIRGVPFSKVARRPTRQSFYFLPASSKPSPPAYRCGYHDWGGIARRFEDAQAFIVLYIPFEYWKEQGPVPGFENAIVVNATNRHLHVNGVNKISEISTRIDLESDVHPGGDSFYAQRAWTDTEHVRVHCGSHLAKLGLSKTTRIRGPRSGRLWSRLFAVGLLAPPLLLIALSHDPGEVPKVVEAWAKEKWTAFHGNQQRDDGNSLDMPSEVTAKNASEIKKASFIPVPPTTNTALRASNVEDIVRPSNMAARNRELQYAVQIAAYDRLEFAVRKQQEFGGPELSLFVTLIPREGGKERYRLLAGPFPDVIKAEQTMASLVTSGLKEKAREWDIRPTRFAFAFQTFSELEEAQQEITKLLEHRIPAYYVRVATKDKPLGVSYQIYAGGYEAESEATTLRKRINEAGFDATLVPLVGLSTL